MDFGLLNLIDILVVSILFWLGFRYLRQTRAGPALLGLAAMGAIYALASWLRLDVTAALFQAASAVVVLVLVVVFQDDLRRLFERVGASLGTARRIETRSDEDSLARTIVQLAAQKTGALIVLPGHDPIERHLQGGITLHGQLSGPLLLSLFDASSPGHDGAVLLRDGKVERFAVHLPLSVDHAQLGPGGTRHAAALGLSERCDALCIVVSEERGTVAVAHNGTLRVLDNPESIGEALALYRLPETRQVANWRDPRSAAEIAAAIGAATLLWVALVPGATSTTLTLLAPVEIENLPAGLRMAGFEPTEVEVTLTGMRRDLARVSRNDVSVRIDADLARAGRRTFNIEPDLVRRPDRLEVFGIEPSAVRITLQEPGTNP